VICGRTNENSKSGLRSENGLLKDVRYRGKSTSRKDLFEGPRLEDIEQSLEDNEEDEESADEDEGDDEDYDHDEEEEKDEEMQVASTNDSENSSEVEDSSDVEEDLDGFEEENYENSTNVQDVLAKHDALLAMPLQEPVNTDAEKGKDIKLQQVLLTFMYLLNF